MNTAIIMGVGPVDGLGGQLAKRFASLDLHVFIAGRTASSIDAVAADINAAGGKATAFKADATNETEVAELYTKAAAAGPVKLAIYNAGNNTPGALGEMSAEYFEASWRICCLGGFLFGREAIKHMRGTGGALLFTGASASLRGRPNFGAFNSSKAALRVMAQAMAKEYGPEQVHVGHVVVDGAINGEKIKEGYPEFAEQLGEDGLIDLSAIVDAFEYLYQQPKRGWSFEVDVRTAIENW
ncbi:MAG: SDR family NAD(P)-dependent oxidoreductase [Pseudomonadota bacterium]